jgi:hypothetical protein
VEFGRGCTETGAVLAAAAAVVVGGNGTETGAVLATTAAMGVGGDGAEMGAVLAATAAMGAGGGGAEICAMLAAITAMGVGGGGAEGTVLAATAAMGAGGGGAEGAVLAATAGLDAETNALGKSRWEKSILKPAPRAMEKRMVRTLPNGVVTASAKVTIQLVFLFVTRVTGGTRTNALLSFFCMLFPPRPQAAVVRLKRWLCQILVLTVPKTNGFQVVSSTASIVETRDSSLILVTGPFLYE